MLSHLSYRNPQTGVFLRRLAWDLYVAGKTVSVQEAIDKYVQASRKELGLNPYLKREQSGASDAFLQTLYRLKVLAHSGGSLQLTEDAEWKQEWRLLNVPAHEQVRQLSLDPVFKDISSSSTEWKSFSLSLRNPATPRLHLYVGNNASVAHECRGKRGVYYLGLDAQWYVGCTDELNVRWRQHQSKKPKWVVFLSFEEVAPSLTIDALKACESLLISFWNEVSRVSNDNRGSDRKPAFPYLQQAIMMTQASAAAFLWLSRSWSDLRANCKRITSKALAVPFRKCPGLKNWPACYLQPR